MGSALLTSKCSFFGIDKVICLGCGSSGVEDASQGHSSSP